MFLRFVMGRSAAIRRCYPYWSSLFPGQYKKSNKEKTSNFNIFGNPCSLATKHYSGSVRYWCSWCSNLYFSQSNDVSNSKESGNNTFRCLLCNGGSGSFTSALGHGWDKVMGRHVMVMNEKRIRFFYLQEHYLTCCIEAPRHGNEWKEACTKIFVNQSRQGSFGK